MIRWYAGDKHEFDFCVGRTCCRCQLQLDGQSLIIQEVHSFQYTINTQGALWSAGKSIQSYRYIFQLFFSKVFTIDRE